VLCRGSESDAIREGREDCDLMITAGDVPGGSYSKHPQLTKLWTDHRRRSAKPRWAVAAELHPGTYGAPQNVVLLSATATAGGFYALHSGVTTMRLCAAQFSMSISELNGCTTKRGFAFGNNASRMAPPL
jgi:hypothetical protein